MKLGVNIDHVAVLREARAVNDPDILEAMYVAVSSGADQITVHLREDRRHINEKDLENIINLCKIPVNAETSINPEIIDIICDLKPSRATIVPEKRAELTTEGGLNLSVPKLEKTIEKLNKHSIPVSLFIEPNVELLQKVVSLGANCVEFHTGKYANAFLMLHSNLSKTKYSIKSLEIKKDKLFQVFDRELNLIKDASVVAKELGISVAAGHGLNYQNVKEIVKIDDIFELNIGQSIIARSVFVGLYQAIKEMKKLCEK